MVNLGVGIVAGALLALIVSPWAVPAVCLGATGSILLGWVWPKVASTPYRVWNGLARRYAHLAHLLASLATYYVVFVAVSLAGSKLALDPGKPGQASMWVPLQEKKEAEEVRLGRWWVMDYVGWARKTGNWWALACLPFFVLLSALGRRQTAESSFPSSIYTLY